MKSSPSKIIAWQPVLTDHQAFTYQQLKYRSNLPLVVQVLEIESKVRRAQGWLDISVSDIQRFLIPKSLFFLYSLQCLINNRNAIHIFGGAFGSFRMFLVLLVAVRLCSECYLISEPYSPVALGYLQDENIWLSRLKAWLRPGLYRFYMMMLRSHLTGVFAISRLGVKQFISAGMPSDRVFPFGYFVPISSTLLHQSLSYSPSHPPLRLVFIGSLISRKGLAILIDAVRLVVAEGIQVCLDVYGPGSSSSLDADQANITFKGQLPFGCAQKFLPNYDILVLPSYYDGWGVVVNEALCAGIPVLCSDQVGAGVLVDTFGAGQIFPSGNSQSLANIIVGISTYPSKLHSMKVACSAAAKSIQPDRAAAYMYDVISADASARSAISSPWYHIINR